MIYTVRQRNELIHLLQLASEDKKLFSALLDDLFTPEEIETLARRWQIIKELQKKTPQREIADKLGVAIATVTRGSRMLKNPNGDFARIIRMILSTKNPTGSTKTWRNQLME